MGKAFTAEDRVIIQDKLRRVGLKLFYENGIKGVSIRKLTREADISQGGFYTFYKDKEEFIIDLLEFRISEKLFEYEKDKSKSLENPSMYLSTILFKEGMHLKNNKGFSNKISSSLDFFYDREKTINKKLSIHYRNFFNTMVEYWESEGYQVKADIDGLISTIVMAGIMFSNSSLIDSKHFALLYKSFCLSSVDVFLEIRHD